MNSAGLSARIVHFLSEECGLTKDSMVADVGCGPGILSRMFLENGNRVIGVEPNEAMREAAKEYLAGYDYFEVIDGRSDATDARRRFVQILLSSLRPFTGLSLRRRGRNSSGS